MPRLSIILVTFGILACTTIQAAPPSAAKFLEEGKLSQGITELQAHLKATPADDNARFGLGVTQFLRAIEHMVQSFHEFGLHNRGNEIPFLRVPTPPNPNPKTVSYELLRKVFLNLLDDLKAAEKTLSEIKGDVQLPLAVANIRLDLNGDGKAGDDESFWGIYTIMNGAAAGDPKAAQDFVIKFDTADALWLQGYCHLLMAFDEFILAHDWKDSFDRTAQLFFPKTDTPYKSLVVKTGDRSFIGDSGEIADVITFIHMIRYPVTEKDRMKNVREHLLQMITLSRKTWKAIAAETDDDQEWLPGPRQTGVIPGVKVDEDMVHGWHDFLDEAENILNGKTLLPHWRIKPDRGINLRKVFDEPQTFDAVLLIQGTGVEPFLQPGTITKPETWTRLQRIFRGEFIGFAFWFN